MALSALRGAVLCHSDRIALASQLPKLEARASILERLAMLPSDDDDDDEDEDDDDDEDEDDDGDDDGDDDDFCSFVRSDSC